MTELTASTVDVADPRPIAMPVAMGLPAPRPQSQRARWVWLGTIVFAFAGVIAYGVVGLSQATQSIDRAQTAIRNTLAHEDSLAAALDTNPFKNIDLTTNAPDIAGAKTALATFEPKVAAAQALERGDTAALQKARHQLTGSFLTLPEQGMLAGARSRVDAALAGLAAADQQLTWRQQQVAFIHPYLDAMDGWLSLVKAARANDLVGVASQLQVIRNAQQKASSLAKPPAIPSQVITLVNTLQTSLNDVQGLLNAIRADDRAAYEKSSAALAGDGDVLSKVDMKAITDTESALFDPLTKQYNDDMKRAATGS